MNETIRNQILAIRDTGLTNMFDVFLEEHRKEYVQFILYGDE